MAGGSILLAHNPPKWVNFACRFTGRSDSRVNLRRFFEVDANHIAAAAMVDLFRDGAVDEATLKAALAKYDIDGAKPNPRLV